MPRGKKRTASVRRVSPRTSEDGTSSDTTSGRTVTATATEAIGRKRARHGQERNDNTTNIVPDGTASNNSEPLTRGDIPSLVREIVNTLTEGTGGPSFDGGATSDNEGSIPRGLGQSAGGLDRTSRSGETGSPRQQAEAGMLSLIENSDIHSSVFGSAGHRHVANSPRANSFVHSLLGL